MKFKIYDLVIAMLLIVSTNVSLQANTESSKPAATKLSDEEQTLRFSRFFVLT